MSDEADFARVTAHRRRPQPDAVLADTAYASVANRRPLRERGIKAVISREA